MPARTYRPFPDPPPAAAAELAGRLVLAIAFVALILGVFASTLQPADGLSRGSLKALVFPRLAAFVLAALVAGLVQGARAPERLLLICGLLAGALALFLLPAQERPMLGLRALAESAGRETPALGATLGTLVRFEAAVLAAVLVGTWLGRLLEDSGHLLVVVLCAAAGDAWLSMLQVPETVGPGHPVSLMRLNWPPAWNGISVAPTFPDVLFLAVFLEAARRLRFHGFSVAFGAVAGYAVASFLSLATWRVMLALPMVGLGVLMGAWPDFRCSAREVIKAFTLALILFAALVGLTSLHKALHPPPQPRHDPLQYRNIAAGEASSPRGFRIV